MPESCFLLSRPHSDIQICQMAGKAECLELRFLIYDKADDSAVSIIVEHTSQPSVIVPDVSLARGELSQCCLFLSVGKLH